MFCPMDSSQSWAAGYGEGACGGTEIRTGILFYVLHFPNKQKSPSLHSLYLYTKVPAQNMLKSTVL